jgi:hypothetical protein
MYKRIYLFSTSLLRASLASIFTKGHPMPPRRSAQDRIEELAQKKAQLEAQISALDARERLGQKKDEDRLKWLLGTLVFDRLSDEPSLQEWVRRELPARLTDRDHKRGLWSLLFPNGPK